MDVYEALYTTRAMRRVKPDPIPMDVPARILDAAVRAPSGDNTQNWRSCPRPTFPHPSCLYGDEVHDRIAKGLGDTDDETRRTILWSNAEQLYKITPPTAGDTAKLPSSAGAN